VFPTGDIVANGGVVTIIRGADHFLNFTPEVVSDIIGEWILTKEGEG
jgi:hypothetical protein